jgi:hypothetical protein
VKLPKLRKSAKGQDCTLNVSGVCSYDPETVVLCHLPDGSGGMGMKSDDLSSCFGCYDCHQVLDGHVRHDFERGEKEFYMRRAQTRTFRKWLDMGIIKI